MLCRPQDLKTMPTSRSPYTVTTQLPRYGRGIAGQLSVTSGFSQQGDKGEGSDDVTAGTGCGEGGSGNNTSANDRVKMQPETWVTNLADKVKDQGMDWEPGSVGRRGPMQVVHLH